MKMNIAGRLIRSMTSVVPAQVEVWWDQQQQLWTIQLKDHEGNQIGDADHAAQKRDATAHARALAEMRGVEVIIRRRGEG